MAVAHPLHALHALVDVHMYPVALHDDGAPARRTRADVRVRAVDAGMMPTSLHQDKAKVLQDKYNEEMAEYQGSLLP